MRVAIAIDDTIVNAIEALDLGTAASLFPQADVFDADAVGAGIGSVWDGEAWVSPPPPAPVAADVDTECDRRIAAGFMFGGTLFQSRPEDRENIMGAATAALGAMMLGAAAGDYRWHGGESDFLWIAADNSTHVMDAQTVYAFGLAAMAHKTALIFAARAIKDADPIPADYIDDGYWP